MTHIRIATDGHLQAIGTSAEWRGAYASGERPLVWSKGYGAPEASLLLDPTTTDIEDMTEFQRRALLCFCIGMNGKFGSSNAAQGEARDYWGISDKDLGLPAASSKDVKAAIYRMPTDCGFYLPTDEKPRGYRTVALAPARNLNGELTPTGIARNTYNLQRYGMASVPVPRLIRDLSLLRELCEKPLNLLLLMYGLNDLPRHGGVDPTHMYVTGDELVVSDALARGWRYSGEDLVAAFAEIYDAGLVALVPATLENRRWYPAADGHVAYLGETDADSCDTFVVRPVHQVERFAGSMAA